MIVGNGYRIINGDCLKELKKLKANVVHSVIVDPPYELGFMGKKWDKKGISFNSKTWVEVLRVLRPGGHLLCFGGTKTFHRIATAIEDAGFEIRDCLMWVYGSGFPKGNNISRSIDNYYGVEREITGYDNKFGRCDSGIYQMNVNNPDKMEFERRDKPATKDGIKWDGWNTALKPAWEPIILARKPIRGTIAKNVLKWDTGGLNIDACRVEGEPWKAHNATGLGSVKFFSEGHTPVIYKTPHISGRWPANLIHDGSEEVKELFPETSEGRFPSKQTTTSWKMSSKGKKLSPERNMGDSGSAARFFYCAKATKKDRDDGCEDIEPQMSGMSNGAQIHGEGYDKGQSIGLNRVIPRKNNHPTVKPTALMRYLCRLITPSNGIVLDPFMGSGSTGKAALLEGFQFIGIELEKEYCEIAQSRIEKVIRDREKDIQKDNQVFDKNFLIQKFDNIIEQLRNGLNGREPVYYISETRLIENEEEPCQPITVIQQQVMMD